MMTLDEIYCYICDCIEKTGDEDLKKIGAELAPYREMELKNRLFITEFGIGQHFFLIEYDKISDLYSISEQIVEDVSACGRVYSYDTEKDFPDKDDMLEPWTPEELDAFHVCFSRKTAETILEMLEKGENCQN